jgi:hypothetical protein
MLSSTGGRELPAPSRAERKIAAASKGHCIVYLVLGDGAGVRVQAESYLEACHFLTLNADPETKEMREQVRFSYGEADEQEHVFDVVVTQKNGTKIAYTIKPEVRLRSGRFLEEMQIVAWWVRERRFANDVRLLTDLDLDEVDLHNAKVFAAVRKPDPEAEAIAMRLVSDLRGAATLFDLAIATGLEARGNRALLRLLRQNHLQLASRTRIVPQALVERNMGR